MGIIIPILGICAGIVAILSNTYLKSKKLTVEKGALPPEKMKKLMAKLEETEELKERVKNLEAIITSMDKEILQLHHHTKTDNLAKEVAQLAEKLEKHTK